MLQLILMTPEELKILIETSIRNVLTEDNKNHESDAERFMTIDELCDYLPYKPIRATIYKKARLRLIPHAKQGKNLVFLKSEIDEWLISGKVKTVKELNKKRSFI